MFQMVLLFAHLVVLVALCAILSLVVSPLEVWTQANSAASLPLTQGDLSVLTLSLEGRLFPHAQHGAEIHWAQMPAFQSQNL